MFAQAYALALQENKLAIQELARCNARGMKDLSLRIACVEESPLIPELPALATDANEAQKTALESAVKILVSNSLPSAECQLFRRVLDDQLRSAFRMANNRDVVFALLIDVVGVLSPPDDLEIETWHSFDGLQPVASRRSSIVSIAPPLLASSFSVSPYSRRQSTS
jgi:hypothetical protein